MTKLYTLTDGLLDQLRDLYSAENQLLKALPKMEEKAANKKLKKTLHAHFLETEGQIQRLDRMGTLLGEKLSGKTCKAMQGLIEEGKEVIEAESENKALLDALLIAAAQRVEHYEMAAYSSAREIALELNQDQIATLLAETLEEERVADEALFTISDQEVLSEANNASGAEGEKLVSENEHVPRTQSKRKQGNAARVSAIVTCLFLSHQFGSFALAENEQQNSINERQASNYEADNTGRNVRDRNDSRITADEQNLSGTDTEILSRIRREIVANKSLSSNAHNIKIMVENGKVLLRGPVKSAQERTWIADAAARLTSSHSVVNQLEIAPG